MIVAKDHHTVVAEDLALISTSAIHMGASSGPASMAWFNDKPYLVVNIVCDPTHFARQATIVHFAIDPAQLSTIRP